MKINKEKFQLAMARACMSMGDIANKLGVSRSAFSLTMKRENIRPALIGRIAKALDVDPIDIIDP